METPTTTQLNPYLLFDGTCAEAINFYQNILGGVIKQKSTFGEGPMEVDAAAKDRIMHIHYEFDGCTILASDGMPGQPVQNGNSVQLSVYLFDKNRAIMVFEKLSEGGHISMPFNEVFWGGSFGICTDKFGMTWMISCP